MYNVHLFVDVGKKIAMEKINEPEVNKILYLKRRWSPRRQWQRRRLYQCKNKKEKENADDVG